MINSFRGSHRWLSNFYETPVTLHGVKFVSVENAYQSAKSIGEEWKATCSQDISSVEIKKLSKTIKVRHDWDQIKDKIMWYLLKQKFSKEPLRSWLINTGKEVLIEGNQWHDNYFGDCVCDKCTEIEGKNYLGKMIMKIRENLQYEGKTIIAGSRDITDYELVKLAIKKSGFSITEVVSGKASGVDTLGEQYARENNIKIKEFPANWDNLTEIPYKIKKDKHGREYNVLAGLNRNKRMGNYADSLIAITTGSNGTQHMIDYATSKGLRVYVHKVEK
jgi:ribA/ribD-fused uncharacterized protein